jgi:type I restriction enzyme S subunit
VKLPAHPRYKSSGIEWLSDVPEHWRVKALKWESPVLRGASPRPIDDPIYFDDDGEYSWVRISDVTTAGMYLGVTEQKLSREGSSVSVKLNPGALFLSIAGSVGKPCITQIKCCIHDGFVYFPRFNGEPKFLYYLFASGEPYRGLGKLGTQLNLNTDTVGSIVAGFPGTTEQRAIAAFLDRETGRIERLVAKKRELIERLREKRTALISRAVTRGLPPAAARAVGLPENPPLKPSGVEWLGDIPRHWDVVPLRYIFYNLDHRRVPIAKEDRANLEKTYPYYGASGIIDYVEDYLFDETLILVAEDGANLLSRSTPLAFIATGKYWVNNHAHILKPIDGDVRFWEAVLQTYDYTPLVTGAAQPKLTSDRLGGIRLPKPTPTEQRAIAAYLAKATGKLHALIEKVNEAVERLQEYRTALITAAVTGKIDVRKAAA